MLGGTLGSNYLGHGRCRFRVWAPLARTVEVHVVTPREQFIALEPRERGYFETIVTGAEPGWRYFYRLDGGEEWPDPASRFQPEGVHGPSEVIDPHFAWHDQGWRAPALDQLIIYELHVGTFSEEGTFDGVIPQLDYLKHLGVTAIEIMPVAQFPGGRNWGYDGAYTYAAQNTYGGPDGLRRLVDACHRQGLAVILDVVYNHMGPEGNYFRKYSEDYFTPCYRTPWGDAINFDGAGSDEVRAYFIENALYWVRDHHIDGLRLDAVHAIKDFSAIPFLEQLAEAVHEEARRSGRRIHVIAESDLNDTRIIQGRDGGGMGLDAQWSDDFHHAVHALLTGERAGYYADFGDIHHLVKAMGEGFVYTGEYSPSRRRSHGRSSRQLPARRFVVCSQNHDQIGNRMLGERLCALSPEAARLAAGLVLLSPYIPLLFMGEEYGETAPFQYFTSHTDAMLVEAVRKGRAEEFSAFAWNGEVPDPHSAQTFVRSRLNHALRRKSPHRELLELYRELIRLRATVPALSQLSKESQEVRALSDRVLMLRRWREASQAAAIFNLGEEETQARFTLPEGDWSRLVDSAGDDGSAGLPPAELRSHGQEVGFTLLPFSFVLYAKGA